VQVLILQFVDPRQGEPRPAFSHALGVLTALLKADGFGVALVPLAGHQPQRLHDAVIAYRPRYVLAELSPYCLAAARRTIGQVAQQFALPVATFGPFATVRPARAASMPGVGATAIGEYEHALLELLRAARDQRDPAGIAGLWVNAAEGLARGALRDLWEDLDALPFPDREVFDCARTAAETHQASFKVARGCPLWCGYCVNDWYMDLYEGKGPFVRRRSVGNVLDEIAQVRGHYAGVREIRFYDHAFAADPDWLAAFAEAYRHRCRLPFRCHVRLQHVTPHAARLLADSRCAAVHTTIPSGSTFIREEIHTMPISAERIVQAVAELKAAGLRVVADVLVGNPYESPITIEDTLELLRRAAPDELHPRVYYPTPGTRAADVCAENAWITGRSEEDYWHQRTVLDMPSCPPDHINETARKLHALLKRHGRTGLREMLNRALWSRRRSVSDAKGE
jgi:radical SAM superfamily enzyme YgiQ (UPF0313 family)